MIKKYCTKSNIFRNRNQSVTDFQKDIIKKGIGLYVVGLDQHTGFIYCDGRSAFFIHSCPRLGVAKQPLIEGDWLKHSKYRVVGKISNDDLFILKWLEGKAI